MPGNRTCLAVEYAARLAASWTSNRIGREQGGKVVEDSSPLDTSYTLNLK